MPFIFVFTATVTVATLVPATVGVTRTAGPTAGPATDMDTITGELCYDVCLIIHLSHLQFSTEFASNSDRLPMKAA